MEPNEQIFLITETEVNAPIEKVWDFWNAPKHIIKWNSFSPEWETSAAENDLTEGGKFLYVMGMKDGSFSFNFQGKYNDIILHHLITYTLDDDRKSVITFSGTNPVKITENFQPDKAQPHDMQKQYCQAVLDSFKRYVENN